MNGKDVMNQSRGTENAVSEDDQAAGPFVVDEISMAWLRVFEAELGITMSQGMARKLMPVKKKIMLKIKKMSRTTTDPYRKASGATIVPVDEDENENEVTRMDISMAEPKDKSVGDDEEDET